MVRKISLLYIFYKAERMYAMVTDARINDLKRKLVRGHKITLQEWVNNTDKDICRYLVLDDILQYHEIPSSTPRYEIFNCSTYGFFNNIEDAEKKYEDILSLSMQISISLPLEMLFRVSALKEMTLILFL